MAYFLDLDCLEGSYSATSLQSITFLIYQGRNKHRHVAFDIQIWFTNDLFNT